MSFFANIFRIVRLSVPGLIPVLFLFFAYQFYVFKYPLEQLPSEERFWVGEALEQYAPVCPIFSEVEIPKNLFCGARHPYYEPAYQTNLDVTSNSVLTNGNNLKLLHNSESFVEKIKLIKEAKESIYIASLQLACSSSVGIANLAGVFDLPKPTSFSSSEESAQYFVSSLIEARKRGVDVRLFLDGEWKWRLREGSCVEELRKNGVSVVYTPFSIFTMPGKPAAKPYRTHEKLFIVDGKNGIVGGQNLAAWWFDSTGMDDNFRDTDVLVHGPVVRQIARRFVTIWKRLKGADSQLVEYENLLGELEEVDKQNNLLGKKNYQAWLSKKGAGICRFVAQDPHLDNYYVLDAYVALATVARSRIRMHIPAIDVESDERLANLFSILIERVKNKTRLDLFTNTKGFTNGRMLELTNTRRDPLKLIGFKETYAIDKTKALYRQLKGQNFNLYAYRSWLHSKLFFFDDILFSVGSFNYDDSATIWSESTLICMDPALSQAAIETFENDELNSTPLSKP